MASTGSLARGSSWCDLLLTIGPFVLLVVVLLVTAKSVLDPTPPKKVALATDVPRGAYAAFGKRYAELLRGYGIDVELRTTQGTAENVALLHDPESGVDLAFVQGGLDETPVTANGNVALARWAVCSTSRCGCSTARSRPGGC